MKQHNNNKATFFTSSNGKKWELNRVIYFIRSACNNIHLLLFEKKKERRRVVSYHCLQFIDDLSRKETEVYERLWCIGDYRLCWWVWYFDQAVKLKRCCLGVKLGRFFIFIFRLFSLDDSDMECKRPVPFFFSFFNLKN